MQLPSRPFLIGQLSPPILATIVQSSSKEPVEIDITYETGKRIERNIELGQQKRLSVGEILGGLHVRSKD